MSGLCGFFNRDGAPANATVVRDMFNAAPHRGPHGSDLYCVESVALGHQALNHLRAARIAPQPLRDEAADLTLVLHGRIDYRTELASELQCSGMQTDAELVLRAYQRWGPRCSDKLCGDFAFAIWDGRKRRLFASRDPSGCIPFFYCLREGVFVFGSELSQLLAHPLVPRRINEGMVAECLSTGFTSKTETLYQDILRLPPGYHLQVDARRCEISRHWTYLPTQQIIYADSRDYQQHFLHLFEHAVNERLDCAGPAGISLSGGLDSSNVAAMAQSLLNTRQGQEKLLAFCMMDNQNQEYDESPFAALVAEKWQFGIDCLPYLPLQLPNWHARAAASGELPDFPTELLNAKLYQAASAKGVTTLFSGGGANSPVGGSRYAFYDHLCARDFAAACAEFRAQRQGGWSAASLALLRSLAWPLMRPGMRDLAEKTRKFAYRSPFLAPDFARRVNLGARHHADTSGGQIANLATWSSWWQANRGSAVYGREVMERQYARHGLSGAHPYLDKRLREFLFAVPANIKRRAGQGKQLLAHSGLVPEEIANTRVQGDYSVPIRRALCSAQVQQTLGKLGIAELGWVQQEQVDRALHIVNRSAGRQIWTGALPPLYLWLVFSMEVWFQSVNGATTPDSAW